MPPPAPVATTAATTAILQLYRRIIKNAKVFPSKGRDRMVKEIREGELVCGVCEGMEGVWCFSPSLLFAGCL